MLRKWPRFDRRLYTWLVPIPTLLIIALMVLMTDTTNASQAQAHEPRVLLTEVLFQEQTPVCQSCHPEEYAAWQGTPHAKATLDPVFHEQLNKTKDQAACLACHTTGFDSGSGKFMSEGVTCEACHGPYKEGHPAAATMQLPMESATCRVCHQTTFDEWESSKHGSKNIECFDCHLAHSQGLRTGSVATLCGACHSERQTEVAHATHGINGVDCVSCHMSAKENTTVPGMQVSVRNHNFQVSADVCAGCHQQTIHTSNVMTTLRQTADEIDPQQLSQQAEQASTLEQQVNDLQQRVQSLRGLSVQGMGLTFGVGGFLGFVGGIVGMALWRKRGNP